MLRLRTFGGLWLEGDEGPLTDAAGQRRRLVLLAALAAAGQKGMSRDALVGLLWPEVDEARARAALSQAVGWRASSRCRRRRRLIWIGYVQT